MSREAETRALAAGPLPPGRRAERYRLTIASGPEAGRSIEGAADPVGVGTREGNALQIDNGTVSRHHFEIEATPLGFLLRDLGSTNGTFVDNLRVREAFLPRRATLRAGEVQLRFEALGEEVPVALSGRDRYGEARGRSAVMRELFSVLERVAPRDLTVLLEGESGTGKERLAEAIHSTSPRAPKPFVVFDCASIPAQLVESELCGHERGAFTGATGRRIGRFEEAHGGTLFLDEIGELPLDLQPKLLRALERREIRRVGGTQVIPVDVRVVAATNRDLLKELNRGAFREDLYYRLAVVRLRVPPLRDRREDIPLLVEHFMREYFDGDEAEVRATLDRVSEASWRALNDNPWPGNVRELRNFIERTLAVSGSLESDGAAAPAAPAQVVAQVSAPIDLARPFFAARDELTARFEGGYLQAMLDRHGGNMARAARAAGIDRMHFKRLLERYKRGQRPAG